MATYTGTERGVALVLPQAVEPDTVFEVRPPGLPEKAVPIFDESLSAVVGYRSTTAGVSKLFDLTGNMVGMDEPGLETPLIDPIELIFFVGGIFRVLGKGFFINGGTRAAPKVAARAAAALSTKGLTASVVGMMRAVFKGLSIKSLRFTATTAARMKAKGRHVPLHILHLAIKYGKRGADPDGVRGAFLYTARLFRNGKPYKLEVVVRESDWTILHFLYK